MKIDDFNKAMELQKELSAKLTSNVEKLRKEKAPPIADTISDQERLIAQAKADLATTEREKELAMKRWDQRIEQRKAAVARLEDGLKRLKKRLDELDKSRKDRT